MSKEAESAYLWCVSADPTLLDRTDLQVEDFADAVNRALFEGMRSLHDSSRPAGDLLLLEAEIGDAITEKEMTDFRLGLLSDVGYINLTNGEHYFEIIREASDRRTYTAALNEAARVGLSGKLAIDEGVAALEAGVSYRKRKDVSLSDIVNTVWGRAEEYGKNPLQPGEARDLDTGWMDLNAVIGGWPVGLHIIEAVPHMGKSWIVLHTAAHACSLGKRVIIFPLEMGAVQLVERLCTAYARVVKLDYKAGRMTGDQYERFAQRIDEVAGWNLIIDSTASSIGQIATVTRRAHRREALDLVVVDPLGLVQLPRGENRNVDLGKITERLKLLSREIDAPILVPHHAGSKTIAARSNKRPLISDLYESGHPEQNADIIISLYRADRYERDTDLKNIMELEVLKDRDGGSTGATVELICDRYGNIVTAARHQEREIWRGG